MGRDEHEIAPGVRGWLESPAFDPIAPDCLIVSGWAFAAGSRIVDVWATGCGPRRALPYGARRDDVVRVYPGEPGAALSGFSGYLEFEGTPGEPVRLEVWAALDDGRTLRLFKRRLVRLAPGRHVSLVRFGLRRVVERPRVLFSPRSWRDAYALLSREWSFSASGVAGSVSVPETLARASRVVLANFLAAGSRLTFVPSEAPAVSIVVVVWNRADLTFGCLRALAAHAGAGAEVIVVDNASTDETAGLLARVRGLSVIRNDTNLGFTVAANLGAKAARGEFLLFLNNDADLLPESIEHLLHTARSASSIGAVGGKLVSPDGRLQEAGSIIWSDGSCEAYGRGGDPAAPEYNFERRVDYCSGALLLTRREIFQTLGGFDERYRPAYYEDTDYCARLWERDFAVVYQPRAVAIHHEFASATSMAASVNLQRARRAIFVSQHARWLSSQLSRADGPLAARSHPHGRPSVVFIDDAVPDPRMGAGFPRAAVLVRALAELGYLTTIYVTGDAPQPSSSPSPGNFSDVEIVADGPGGLRRFLTARRGHHLVIVSRPHNMQYVKAATGADLSTLGAPCVYDAEAVYALREIGRRQLAGQPLPDADARSLIDAELSLARGCAAVLVVSEAERRLFVDAAIPNVFIASHAVQSQPTPKAFDRRSTILFVGVFSQESPNEDAVRFFCRDVLPVLRMREQCTAPIVVAGAGIPHSMKAQSDPTVSWQSDVDDLTPLYDDARVFIVPTRYAAGIPLKVVEAAAHGVPVVCTPLVARQLGWDPGTELLTAENPDDFARAIASLFADRGLWMALRQAALTRVAADYSFSVFRSALQRATIGTVGVWK